MGITKGGIRWDFVDAARVPRETAINKNHMTKNDAQLKMGNKINLVYFSKYVFLKKKK